MVFVEESRKSIVNNDHNDFPEGGEESNGTVVFEVMFVAFFMEEGDNSFTPRDRDFAVSPEVVEDREEMVWEGFKEEFKERVGNAEVSWRGGGVEVFYGG